MEVKVALKHRYGQRIVVPVCENAQIFCRFARTTTLTPHMIENIKSLGYKIVVVPSEPKEL